MEYIIDGAKFKTKKGFYKYIESTFTFGLNWKTGKNLDAFSDILAGGLGKHDYNTKIDIKWKNFKKSEQRLEIDFLKNVLEILEENENIHFVKYDFGI